MNTDEAFRMAKVNRDTAALARILDDGFYEMNQNGNGRDKAEMIELFKTFPISSLTTDSFKVRFEGPAAMVTGTQTENGTERMLFTRVYVKNPAGWQLLSSIQFRNPNPDKAVLQMPAGVEGEVMKADEEFRIAKVNRDTAALSRILADSFNETNQNGNSRDKAQMIELFTTFEVRSLTTDTSRVRVSGGTATVNGTETEGGTERMLFTRVYVNSGAGWQLLASMQFRNPKLNLDAALR